MPNAGPNSRFYLPVNPVDTITSMSHYDADNASQSLAVGDFDLFKFECAYLAPKPDKAWPGLYSRPDALTVVYTAGFGSGSDVPENLKHAIKLIVGDYFETRSETIFGATASKVPLAVPVAALIEDHKRGFVAA